MEKYWYKQEWQKSIRIYHRELGYEDTNWFKKYFELVQKSW